jgi:hypothetical protein
MAEIGLGIVGIGDGGARRENIGQKTGDASGVPASFKKKEPPFAGGSKSKQGGVKQSGQEPLDVQKMDT